MLYIVLFLIVVGAVYLAYQKFMVEDETPLQEPIPTVAPPPSSPDIVLGIDSEKGRPNTSALVDPSRFSIQYYAGGREIVPKGQAKTATVCYEASKARGINNWVWNRTDKSCSAYHDSSIFTAFTDKTKIEETGKYIVGCTETGLKVKEGCTDWSKGDKVRGYMGDHSRIIPLGGERTIGIEECRQEALKEGYKGYMFTTDRHWGPGCYYLTDIDQLKGYTGNNNDVYHMTGCTDTSKKVKDACQ